MESINNATQNESIRIHPLVAGLVESPYNCYYRIRFMDTLSFVFKRFTVFHT